MMSVRTRFAPSPTGFIHLGNVWVAFLNWLYTRQHQGKLVLRIEDIDQTRSRKEYAQALMEDLDWIGLDWDEGPGGTYPYGSAVQSERLSLYHECVERWKQEGKVYPCYCTRARIHKISSAPHRGETLPVYDGHCRNLTDEQRKMQERQPSWRIRIEKETEESFHDLLRGDAVHALKPCEDDFVVMRADGQIAYQLAVSYDDGAMGITHVFRGEDLFSSTFYQTAILKKLEYPVPTYAHLPLLMDKEGNRLSKRQHGITIRDMRAAGVTAEEIIGKLLFWAGAIPNPEPLSATYAEKNIPFSDCRNLKQKGIIVR